MDDYKIIENKDYTIGYYLQKDPNKEICEDALLITNINNNLVVAICDGVGGSDRSYRAAKSILNYIAEDQDLNINIDYAILENKLLELNKKLISLEGSPQTTLTMAIIYKNKYITVQVGDSELIHCGERGGFKYRTNIQSPVGHDIINNKICEEQALKHPDLNIVDNVLGHQDCYIEISKVQNISTNDNIFLASDGLFDNYIAQELIELLYKNNTKDFCNNITEYSKKYQKIDIDKKNINFNKIDDISYICLNFK